MRVTLIAVWIVTAGLAGCSAPVGGGDPVSNTPAGPSVASAPAGLPGTPEASSSDTRVPIRPSSDPAMLARQITAAEQVIHGPSPSSADVEAAAFLEQLVYHKLVEEPHLQPSVLPRLDPAIRSSAEAAVRAGTALRALVTPQEKFPNWRIVDPAPADELRSYYREAESAYGVPWSYLAAIHLVETLMGRIRGVSPAGAQGPMQFLPQTWARYGQGDINSNHDAILAAARLLAANGAPSDMRGALYRYNPSDRYVVAVEAYAHRMGADERAFLAFYHWQVLYRHVSGTHLLPVGYPAVQPESVD